MTEDIETSLILLAHRSFRTKRSQQPLVMASRGAYFRTIKSLISATSSLLVVVVQFLPLWLSFGTRLTICSRWKWKSWWARDWRVFCWLGRDLAQPWLRSSWLSELWSWTLYRPKATGPTRLIWMLRHPWSPAATEGGLPYHQMRASRRQNCRSTSSLENGRHRNNLGRCNCTLKKQPCSCGRHKICILLTNQ